ncbi:MAG: T9SS type A sorting domain-containing protein [Rhodothermaceae bacterium]|nr:T9SS type A sorting domain-containing protein [Rhodothermaceae bacterium]MYF41520.1 T9SS type A sorting domain-containing protein [Rhodothermaceae bacterium]MYH07962.1 T9SS type A sorting domain-containing protein [Rhodothermaceae bacterium]
MLRSIGLAALGLIILKCPCIAAQHRIEALTPAFGHSIAAGDSTLAIGDPSAGGGSGMIWTYRQNPQGGWAPALTLQGTANDSLGYSLAADGHLLVAGAPGNRRAYFYDLRDNQLPQPLSFVTQDTDGYGRAVAVHGIFVAVSSPADQFGRGRIDLYIQSPQNEWNRMQTLNGQSGGEAFGHALAMDSEILLVGAPQAYEPRGERAGLAYIYERTSGSNWRLQAELRGGSAGYEHAFGTSVALGKYDQYMRAVVGAPGASLAYIYTLGMSDWDQTYSFTPVPPVPSTDTGASIALAEDNVIIGAPSSSSAQHGFVWVLRLDELGAGSRRVNLQGGTTFGHAIVAWKDQYAITEPGIAVHIFAKNNVLSRDEAPEPIKLEAYPNPFTESITITLSSNAPDQLFITDIYGRLITSIARKGQNHIRWYPSALAAGMYIISVGKTSKPIIRLP